MDLRARRLAAGMSQSELARAAKVAQPNISAYENSRRIPSSQVKKRLTSALQGRPSAKVSAHRDAILALVAAHHATDARIFGSVARGDDEFGSDVDIVVTFSHDAGLLDEVGLRLALTDLLQVNVDVVASDSLRGEFGTRVLTEAVPL